MKVEHQVRAFEQLFKSYDGVLPLHRYLFAYFKQNKQMGSSDRRWATRYAYSFFRLGKALSKLDLIERLAVADFLCNDAPSLVINHYLKDLENSVSHSVDKKIALIKKRYPSFKIEEVFPFEVPLSEGIDKTKFLASFLHNQIYLLELDQHIFKPLLIS
jgi:16S rRNA (cytosine967-C5)-methyltransferase